MIWLAFAAPALGATPADVLENPNVLRLGTPTDYASDLIGSDRSDRLFAARELRRHVLATARAAQGRESERQLEARITLGDLHQDVFAATLRALVEQEDVRGACADILAALDDRDALPLLQSVLGEEQRPSVRRRLQRAIVELER